MTISNSLGSTYNSSNSPYFFNSNVKTESNFSLSNYAAIKNGSYKKLLKAYYSKQEAQEATSSGDSAQKRTVIKSDADALKESADTLNTSSLWNKIKITETDKTTGVEITTEDYDWDAITKEVKSFVNDYNTLIKEVGDSDTTSVLRYTVWMAGATKANINLLSKVGINFGSNNKLELDEKVWKKADTISLKSLFIGHNSYASQISQKAFSISRATVSEKGMTSYTSSGAYSSTLSKLVSATVDKEV